MPSPALGSFLRSFSGRLLDRKDEESKRSREDFLHMENMFLTQMQNPALTDAGRAHAAAGYRELFEKQDKGLKKYDIVGMASRYADLFDTEVPEQRTAAGQAPAVSQQIPEDEQGIAQLIHGLSGGPTGIESAGGEREITAAPGGGELVSEAYNPFMRSREDMLSEGMDMQLRKVEEYVSQGLLDPAMAEMLRAQIITKMQPQQPRAPALDPLTKAYPGGGERGQWVPKSQAGGMFAEPSPKPQKPSTSTGQQLADRVAFHSQIMGLDDPNSQLAAQRDVADREARDKETERITAELKKTTLALNKLKLADAEGGGDPRDRANLANSMLQNAMRQAAIQVTDYIEQLQNATGANNKELIAQAEALLADPKAMEELRMQFFNEILAGYGTTHSDLQAILGGATGEAAAAGAVGTIGRSLGQ